MLPPACSWACLRLLAAPSHKLYLAPFRPQALWLLGFFPHPVLDFALDILSPARVFRPLHGQADGVKSNISSAVALLGLLPRHTLPSRALLSVKPGISNCTSVLCIFSLHFLCLKRRHPLGAVLDTQESPHPFHLLAASPRSSYLSLSASISSSEIQSQWQYPPHWVVRSNGVLSIKYLE